MAQPKNINNAILDVLSSIDAKLDASANASTKLNTNLEGMANTGVVSEKEYESFAKHFGEMAKGISTLVKVAGKINDKAAEKIKTVLTSLGEGISAFFKEAEPGQIKEMSEFLGGLGFSIFKLAGFLAASLPFLILAPISAALLGLTYLVLMKVLPKDDKEKEQSLEGILTLLQVAKGILWFGIGMSLYLVLGVPAALGAVLFGLTIRLLMWVLGDSAKNGKEQTSGMESILGIGKGILLFSLSMILFLLVAPIVLIGAVLFGLTIRLMMWIMGDAAKGKGEGESGMEAVLKLAKGILLFALSMLVVVLLFPVLLLGAIIFAVTLWILNMGLKLISTKKARKGVVSLLILGLSILLFALVIALFDKMVSWQALLKVAVALAGLGFIMFMVGKQSTSILKGSIAMIAAAGAVLLIAVAMMIWKSANPDWEDIAKLGATVLVVGVIGAVAGLGPIPGFIMAGSAALIVAGAAILLISTAMAIWTAADVGWEDVGILGATVLMIGVEMGVLGLASPFILAGAFAMGVAAVPLVLITGSLAVFKKIDWKPEDGDALINALDSVVAGFLGGRMPGGIFAMIKFAAKAAARAVLLLITIPPFVLAGLALVPIVHSLKTFKEAKWTPDDSIALEGVMASMIKAFSLPSDYARQKELGIYTSPWLLMLGIWALKDAGSTMASLAEGIQAFANLTVPIYGWVETEGGGELKIVEKRQMNKGDFDKAAYGMSTVIGAIAKPLADVGKLEKGEGTGNPILDAIFAGNFVSTGVSALRNAGDTIVGLAEGVQAFANLSIPVYGLITSTDEQGNTNTKLQVIERKAMTEGDITSATNNIEMVIGVVAGALAKVGKDEAASSGWFTGGNVSKGAAALAGVGENIKAIADTVKGYADLTIFPMELVDGGTKDAKLVPGKPITLTDGDLKSAARSLSMVLGIVVDAIANVGRLEKESKGWFSDGFVKTGAAALGSAGLNIKAIADAVLGFATASFTPMGPDKDGNLVAIGPSKKLGPSELKAAAKALGSVISLMGYEVSYFGKWASKNWHWLEAGNDANKTVSEVVMEATQTVAAMEKVPMSVVVDYVAKMNMIFTGVYNIFSAENAPTVSRSSWFFSKFSANMVDIAEHSNGIMQAGTGFTKMAASTIIWVGAINKLNGKKANQARWLVDSMSKPNAWKGAKSISVSTVRLKEQINGLDIERLKILNSLMCALATLGNSNISLDKLGSSLGEGMKEGFELLAEYLAELIEQGGGGGGGDGDGAPPAAGPDGKPAPKGKDGKPAAAPAAAPAGGDMAKKLKQALESAILTVKIKK